MPSRKYYEATLKRFNAKYQINVSIDALDEAARAIDSVDDLMYNDKEDPSMIRYANLLSDVLKIYLDQNIRMKQAGSYELSDFSLGEFVIDFEELMEEKYKAGMQRGEKPTRMPYEGATLSGVFEFAGNVVEEYAKDLPSLWADGIKKGVMNVEFMRVLTDGEYEKLMGMSGQLEKKVKGELDAETMNRLSNVVAARDAMEKYRNSRSLWRKFIDLFVGGSQRKYLNHLRTICDDLKKNYFPVDQVSSQLKAGKFIPESSYDVANLQKQTKPWLYDVADRFKKLTNVAGFTQMLSFN
jgi:hypothetical protein